MSTSRSASGVRAETLEKRVTVEFADIIAEFSVELRHDADGGFWSLTAVNPIELDDASEAEPFVLDPERDSAVIDRLQGLWTEHIDGTARYFTVVEECVGSHGDVGCYIEVDADAYLCTVEEISTPLTPLPLLGMAILAQAARAAVLSETTAAQRRAMKSAAQWGFTR